MTKRLGVVLILLAGTALGCAVATGGTEPAPTVEGVLFQDDFSDSDSGWDRVSADEGLTDYAGGEYRIFVNKPDSDYWANPGLDFADVSIEVEARKGGGPDDNDLGVICRYQDVDNFYYAVISSDGYAGIIKLLDGQQNLLSGDNLMPADAIQQGNATNAIRLDCVGDSITLYVNGTRVVNVTDAEWPTGDVGLVAGTYDTPGTDIYFDNLIVRGP